MTSASKSKTAGRPSPRGTYVIATPKNKAKTALYGGVRAKTEGQRAQQELMALLKAKVRNAKTGEIRNAIETLRVRPDSSLVEVLGIDPGKYGFKVSSAASAKPKQVVGTEDTLTAARARGAVLHQQMIKEAGGLLSTAEAAAETGISVQALHKRKKNGTALAVPVEGGDTGWPKFQFESPDVTEGVKRVLKKIGVDSPWMQVNFFLMQLEELDNKRPIDLIRAGKIEPVERAASHFGNHGAA